MVSDDVVIVDDTHDQEPVELSEDWVNTEIQKSNEMQLADEFDDWDDAKTLGDSKSDIEEWRAIKIRPISSHLKLIVLTVSTPTF